MKTLIITVIAMVFIVTLSRSGMVLPHGTNQASAVAPHKSPGGAAPAQTNNASADRHYRLPGSRGPVTPPGRPVQPKDSTNRIPVSPP